ncbi:MAG: hypothetical protein ACI97N_002544, partial [Cognaticolwellia sp.]
MKVRIETKRFRHCSVYRNNGSIKIQYSKSCQLF